MSRIQKSELRQISYAEFGQLLEQLTQNIQNYCTETGLSFELIVPILRSGAFPGVHIASKLQITNILPVQYKYIYQPTESLVQKFTPPQLNFSIKPTSSILIVDTNTVYGETAAAAIASTRELFPQAQLYFASVLMDHTVHLQAITKHFYAKLTNNKRTLPRSEAMEKGLLDEILIFPWEDLEQEWSEMQTYNA